MSAGGRGEARGRLVRRTGIAAAVLVIVALVFFASGHWILGLVFAAAAAAAVWVFVQARAVR